MSTPGELADAIAEELVSGNWHRLAARADRLSAVKAIIHSHLLRTIPSGADAGLAREFDALAKAATQGEAAPIDTTCGNHRVRVKIGHSYVATINAVIQQDSNAAFIAWSFNHRAEISRALRSVTTTPDTPSLRQTLLAMLPSDWDQQSMPGFAREMIEALRKAEL